MPRINYLCLLVLFFVSSSALAYVGPGPGLSMIGSFFTLLGGILLALLMVLLYPIRLLYKKLKRSKQIPPPE